MRLAVLDAGHVLVRRALPAVGDFVQRKTVLADGTFVGLHEPVHQCKSTGEIANPAYLDLAFPYYWTPHWRLTRCL
jgi:hypothetical protein